MNISAASSAKYSYVKVDKSKTYYFGEKKLKANVYFKKPVLEGKSKQIKSINKSLKNVIAF